MKRKELKMVNLLRYEVHKNFGNISYLYYFKNSVPAVSTINTLTIKQTQIIFGKLVVSP